MSPENNPTPPRDQTDAAHETDSSPLAGDVVKPVRPPLTERERNLMRRLFNPEFSYHDELAEKAAYMAGAHRRALARSLVGTDETIADDPDYMEVVFKDMFYSVKDELLYGASELASAVSGKDIGWIPDDSVRIKLPEQQLTQLRTYMAEFVRDPGSALDIEQITPDTQLQSRILRQFDELRLDRGYEEFDRYISGIEDRATTGAEIARPDQVTMRFKTDDLVASTRYIVESASRPEVGDAMNAAFDYKRLEAIKSLLDSYTDEVRPDITKLVHSASSEEAKVALALTVQAFAKQCGIQLAPESLLEIE